jgi:hypothetical protein
MIPALTNMVLMKSKDNWEQETEKLYSEMYESASHILETRHTLQATYAAIESTLAGIQEHLQADSKQGQQVVKLKRHFWSRAETDTFSGHMKGMGKKIRRKFVTDTETLCGNAVRCYLEFDLKKLGEFLEMHGVKAGKMDRLQRQACYEEIIRQDPCSKPRFFNLRRNLIAIVDKLSKKSEPNN